MSVLLNWITATSMVALGTLLFYRDFKTRSRWSAVLHAILLMVAFFILRHSFGFFERGAVPKGDSEEIYFVILLYAFMLLGMFASYAYQHFGKEKSDRKRWDWGLFLAPVFVSPLIFVPLLTALQNAGGDSPRMMMFLVPFQNGFLWKEYFDQKRKRVDDDPTAV